MVNNLKGIFLLPKIPTYLKKDFFNFHLEVDKIMLVLLLFQWFIATFITSIQYDTALYGFAVGGFIAMPMIILYFFAKGEVLFRAFVGVAMMLFSMVFIQQYYGRIEMHFHIFIAMAILTLYQDCIPLMVAATTTILHHLVFNYLQFYEVSFFGMPVMVFNYGCGLDIVLLHAVFVLIELFVLVYFTRIQVKHAIHLHSIQNKMQTLNQALQYKSSHDTLTGLANRHQLHEDLEKILVDAEENNSKFAIIFLDIDHFKNINDTLGHDVGDALLQVIASILKNTLPKKTLIARIGGDEFVMVCHSFFDPSKLVPHISNLLTEFKRELFIKNHSIHISGSVGISIYPDDSTDIKELMKYADIAMYKSKQEGRDTFNFFTQSLNNEIHSEVEIMNDMEKALYSNQFELYYQPKIDVKTKAVVGAEALIRWNHPKKGMIPPAVFIPLAENTGLIYSLGLFIIKETINAIKTLASKGYTDHIISLNLSAREFQNTELLETIENQITQAKINTKQLAVEITESIMMHDTKTTLKMLKELQALGISIYIDDFGTGYSSLAYLQKFPIDVLKIDKSFVDKIDLEKQEPILLDTIIAMGKTMGLKVIAEGVETKDQVSYLEKKECDIIQGYYFAKPMPFKEFLKFCEK